jgi:hypothetical protein
LDNSIEIPVIVLDESGIVAELESEFFQAFELFTCAVGYHGIA